METDIRSKIKFLVDESSGAKLFRFLLDRGFDTKFATDIMPRAIDEVVLDLAQKEDRILITNDKDFGELVFRLNRPSSGIILLRLKFDSAKNRQDHLEIILGKFLDKLKSNFIVVAEGQIRIRKIK